jgi:8-amino-7-oxononanoate synthase
MGEQIEGDIFDCSSTGLKTLVNKNEHVDGLNEGDIVPAAKIAWEGREVALGRLVVRRLSHDSNRSEVAFSTVDIQVPVTGVLSKYLEIDFDKDEHFDDKELNIDKFSLAHFIENEYTNVDLFDRVREFSIYHREWLRSDRYAYQNVRHNSKGNRVNLTRQRKSGRSDYILFGSNDYLGLGSHPEVVDAARNALDVYGFGSTGSPVTTGQSSLHIELCKKLAKIHNKEAAILFNSGYTANIGIICALTSTNDLIIADQLCHASIQDAMQMSRATSRFFKHNNIEHLRATLEKERGNFNGCLIVTEGVFSMDGDVAHLDKIFELAREFNARIMVDQAHCLGVLGPNGMGVCDKFNLLRETDVIMGTFSKICGGIGGFAVGSQDLIDWLRSFSRAQIFTVSLPPSTVAAVSKSLDLFTENTHLVDLLRKNIKHFVKGLRQLGCTNLTEEHESAVIPVVIGDEGKMGAMYQSLLEDGIICTPVVYPAVGKKNCRFRFTMMATHSISDIDYAIACIEKAMLKVGFKFTDKNSEPQKDAHKKSA